MSTDHALDLRRRRNGRRPRWSWNALDDLELYALYLLLLFNRLEEILQPRRNHVKRPSQNDEIVIL